MAERKAKTEAPVKDEQEAKKEEVQPQQDKKMDIYNKSRECPKTALREIQSGRLKGKSDINPMWRIKKLTELFGPCGIGWKYTIDKQWTETCSTGEIAAFVNISLYFKYEGQWSEAIIGTGGSSFVAAEKSGLHLSDECYKMALTDAISVACKALGFAADVYWNMDSTKYSENSHSNQQKPQPQNPNIFTGKQLKDAIAEVNACQSRHEINEVWSKHSALQQNLEFRNATIEMCKKYPE
jgi:hypothetical protein|nr:MAG TPA_asm: DNA repair protein-like protein [Caudoviricetes sp.]